MNETSASDFKYSSQNRAQNVSRPMSNKTAPFSAVMKLSRMVKKKKKEKKKKNRSERLRTMLKRLFNRSTTVGSRTLQEDLDLYRAAILLRLKSCGQTDVESAEER